MIQIDLRVPGDVTAVPYHRDGAAEGNGMTTTERDLDCGKPARGDIDTCVSTDPARSVQVPQARRRS